MGCVYAYVILLTVLGPEYRGKNFDVAADEDMAVVTGADEGKYGRRQDSEDAETRGHV
jgi:SHS family lactate transporter-like MFS transporter